MNASSRKTAHLTARRVADTARRPRSPMVFVAGVAAACVLAASITGGVTYAAWVATDSAAGRTITAGDLSLTRGTPTWEQITPGVVNPASGTLTSTPDDFYSMPGDVIEITVPVSTYLRGDNIAGGLTVDFAAGTTGSSEISTSFHVENAAGQQVGPTSGEAQFGQVVAIPGLVGDNDGESANWIVVVTVVIGGEYQWGTSQTPSFPQSWDAGTLTFKLDQIRHGTGFTSQGGNP